MSWVAIISTIAIGAAVPTAGPTVSTTHAPVTGLTEAVCRQMQHDMSRPNKIEGVTILQKVRCYDNSPEAAVIPRRPVAGPIGPEVEIQDDLVPIGPEIRNGRPTGRPQFEIVPHMPDPVDPYGRR